ncbi:hypothetical protein D3C80_502580 [compost metagenome]
MSRTIRRKNLKNPYLNYKAEEFSERRSEYEAGEWRGENRHFNYLTGEWKTYKKKWWYWEVSHYATFDHYKSSREAKHHADHGYKCGRSGAPKRYRIVLERRFRARHKCQVIQAVKNDTADDLLLKPFVHDAAWWYW